MIIDSAFKEALDKSPIAACIIRMILDKDDKPLDWEFIYCNDALAKLEHLEKDRLINHTFYSLFPKADKKWLIPYYEAACLNKSSVFEEISHEIGKYLRISISQFRDNFGYALCFLEDIQQMHIKETDDALSSIQTEQSILDALSLEFTCVQLLELKTGKIEILKQGKFSNSEWAGQQMSDEDIHDYGKRVRFYFDHIVYQEEHPDFLKEIGLESIRRTLREKKSFVYQYHGRRNLAGNEYFEIKFVKIDSDDGNPKAIIGLRYIDDSVKASQESKKKLEEALSKVTLSNEIISSISKIYRFIYRINLLKDIYEEVSAEEEILKLTGKRGCLSENTDRIVESQIDSGYWKSFRLFFDSKTLSERLKNKETIESEYLGTDGNYYEARFIVKKRDVEGNVTNVLYLVRDITERKEKERSYQERLIQKSKGDEYLKLYRYNNFKQVSQSIRTPLIKIRSLVKVADSIPSDENFQAKTRKEVYDTSLYVLSLLNNLVEVSKIESNSLETSETPFNLRKVLTEFYQATKSTADEIGIHMLPDSIRIRHPYVVGNQILLTKILSNILSNSLRYNRPNEEIRLSCQEIECDGIRAVYRFKCEDTGKGMKEDFQKKVFEYFTHEDQENTCLGLGLPVAKKLVDRLGGTLTLKSRENIGTTVEITLPFVIDFTPKIVDDETTPRFKKSKILIAEDDEETSLMIRSMLDKFHLQYTFAKTGEEALKIFESSKIDEYSLLLLDVVIPVYSGLMVARKIRAMKRMDVKELPILSMSSHAFLDDIQNSLEAGMNEHIYKPFDEKTLISTLAKYLSESSRE